MTLPLQNPKPFLFFFFFFFFSVMVVRIYVIALLAYASVLGLSQSDKAPNPSFAFSWLDDNNTFKAGDLATIKIKLLDDTGTNLTALNLTITINGKIGNSSYISGVCSHFKGDPSTWTMSFIPISVGVFNVLINDNDDRFRILDSSLHFQVTPGTLYPSASVASWMNLGKTEFVAGTKATVLVLPKDAFGNSISSTPGNFNLYNFTVSAFYTNGSMESVLNVTHMGWDELGYFHINFIVSKAGSFLLHVEGGNQTLNGCPLPFKVNPGPLDFSKCEAEWNFGTNALEIFSKMEVFIHQKDEYGNLVPGLYPFDAQVIKRGTNLAIPIAELHFDEVAPGTQLFSSSMLEPGNFLLTIFDMEQNKSISKMPYDFTVFVGYCDGLNSVINGSGLESSVAAGEVAKFSVYLNDRYQYPSPVELEMLRVQIMREVDSYHVWPTIYPMHTVNGTTSISPTNNLLPLSHNKIAPGPSLDVTNSSGHGGLKVQASGFDVIYTPEKSGIYEIRVFCGNIQLNGNHSFRKEVRAGEVDVTLSGVINFARKVPKLVKNEILVRLMDSFSNPVLLQQSRLNLEIGSVNSSGFQTWMFEDNNNGSYVGYYLAKDVGTYELCASFDGNHFLPCPFGVNVYSNEYFPRAYNDTISVWEDESIAFDALANDFFAGGNASIVNTSKPVHGSLIQYRQLFRYTPYKGFWGNDTFLYTISDVNGNLATAGVYISVLSIPPQFVSFPTGLQATEDLLSPKFGGFLGFSLQYSDMMENISVTLSAQSGTIFLSPMPMQFGKSMWSGLSVTKRDSKAKELTLEGVVEVINSALYSFQYLGDENFCGDDIIRLSTRNRNGINELNVPILVEPINDPPYINAPEFIILKSGVDESLIFDKERDKFEFFIDDPDLLHFPGSETQFLVSFSMEVTLGFLVASLPAELINTTELKLKSSYQWQPLQTYVTISKHFMVKAKGLRFRGTVNDCNSVMQQLLYNGGDHGAVLTLTLDDMGNYGCYPDCVGNISVPLYVEASVNLIRRSPMSSTVAHTLGSAIVLEFFMVFSLGAVLMFFTCKCAIVLVNEKRERDMRNVEPSGAQTSHQQQTLSTPPLLQEQPITSISDNGTGFTGHYWNPFLPNGSQPSNFCQRSCRQSTNVDSSKEMYYSAQTSSSDHTHPTPVPNFMALSIEKGPN